MVGKEEKEEKERILFDNFELISFFATIAFPLSLLPGPANVSG